MKKISLDTVLKIVHRYCLCRSGCLERPCHDGDEVYLT